MKLIKKTLILLCSALVLALSFALAACGGKPKLKFETYGGTEIAPIVAEAGEDISALLPPDPVKPGNVFGGWYLDQDFEEKATLPDVMPEKSVTYYAKWTASSDAARLTLDAGNGGTLAETVFDVPVGTDLSAFLAEHAPVPADGLTFAGWYRGAAPLAEGEIMPAQRLTLTAKYYASFTVQVYTQNADGTYSEPESVTGRAIYGEPFSCADFLTVPEHFRVTAGGNGVVQSDALGAHETFTAYLARESHYVTYLPNAPEEEMQVGGATPMQAVLYEAQPVASDCGFTLTGQSRYRFVGWAEAPAGDVVYEAGAPMTVTGDITLYAVWEKGYTDVFGGQDVLYPDRTQPTVIRLVREGVETKVGTYAAATGLFSFKDGQKPMLDGRLLAEAEQFFYFRDTLNGEYADLDGTSATLAMSAGGTVAYTDEAGASHTGKYSIDPDTGYFFFDDDAGEAGDFFYNLYNAVDSDEVVFRRQSTEELGYYYDEEAGVVLYLDGLGGLRYFYNEKNAEYQDFFGDPIYVAYGYYEWMAEAELFLAYTRDIVVTLKQFTFSRTEQAGVTPAETYPELPSTASIKGTVDLDDGLRGSYIAKREDSENALYLDGYGAATFGEKAGSYDLFTWLYSYEEEDGEVIDDYYLVRFTPDDGSEITYFRLDTIYGDYEFDRVFTSEETAAYEDYDFGRYDFKNVFLLNVTFDGFIMIFENGDAEVWTQYGVTTQGNIVYVLYLELVSTVVKDENDIYTFQDTRSTTGQSNGNEFRFTVDSAKKTMSVVLPEEHVTAHVAEGLELDYTARKATYQGKDVEYWYTIGQVDFYTFAIGADEELNFWVESGQTTGFHPVADEDIYDLYVLPGEEDDYYSRLIFTDEGRQAFLAFMLESGMYRVVGVGTTEELENGDYHFTLTGHIPNLGTAEFRESGYEAFDYRLASDGTFRKKSAWNGYANFTTEGYGTFVFTDAAGIPHTGMIDESIGEGNSRIIRFMDTQGMLYTLAVDRSDPGRLVSVTEDGGYWYEMDDNQLISLSKYLILNGQGQAFYYEIEDLTGVMLPVVEGTYTRSPRYAGYESDAPFPEYAITLNGETNNYLLATYLVTDNTTGEQLTFPLYQQQIAHRVGEFTVRGGGNIESVGYPGILATYTDSRGNVYEGNMYIGNTYTADTANDEKVTDEVHDHSFVNDAAGTQVRFWVYENGISTSTEFIFALENGVLVPLNLPYGRYASYSSRDGIVENRTLFLDGLGGATYSLGAGTRGIAGRYSAIRGTDNYQFTPNSAAQASYAFRFRLNRMTDADATTYYFEQYEEGGDLALYCADDWSLLTLDGFGGAVCINRYGDRIIGTYALFAEGYGAFESDTFNAVFSYANGTYAFADHTAYLAAYYAEDFSAVLFNETRAFLNGAEYFYTVENKTAHLYAVGGNHAASTLELPDGATYTYNGKQYYRYAGGAVTFTDSEFSAADPILLTFTPDGAAFTAAATFGGYEGYTVTVAYEKGAAKATLGYRASAMDSLPEEYALTLHFAAGTNTFTVAFTGSKGTYTQEGGPQGNTIILDNRRVGAYSVALHDENAGDTLIISLQSIKNSAGDTLAFSGSVALMQQDVDTHYTYGYSHIVRFEAADGVTYSLRFWLNEAGKQFLLHSVTVETAFEIEDVGEVTFVQLWAAGTKYGGEAQKTLVKVSMHETGAATTIHDGLLGDGKAALVRQNLNTTTGSYDYEAYVFNITYGADGIVSSAEKEGNYIYGEAEQGSGYRVRFLYTTDGTSFEVAYLLTFTADDHYVNDATFAKNPDGSWTVTSERTVYRVTIGRTSNGFTLTVTSTPQS